MSNPFLAEIRMVGFYFASDAFGRETVTLNVSQMPSHNHLVTADGAATDTVASNPSGHWLGPTGLNLPGANEIYSRTDPLTSPVTMHPQMINVTGGDQPHSNLQPFLVVNFIIALQGIFPSQS